MNDDTLRKALLDLPNNAPEPIVNTIFAPEFLNALGFNLVERVPQYPTVNSTNPIDYALRHNTDSDIFINTKTNPYLLLELKGRDINLSEGSAQYKSTVNQLKSYLLGQNCKTVQWGIITNSNHIQLFRKHGKVIYPASCNLEIKPDNIIEITQLIKQKIESTPRALTVAIYNNKGGVGKTTTTVNLAAMLTLQGKKVLIVDFDTSQRDLTRSLEIKPSKQTLYSWLEDKNNQISLQDVICPYGITYNSLKKSYSFDVIPADDELANSDANNLRQVFKLFRLRQVLNTVKSEYDYILIDSPPNWNYFSQSALFAADVVLIPTKHNNIYSLENAATAIKSFIPEVHQLLLKYEPKDAGPTALPIFFNGEKITEAQKITAQQAISKIISEASKDKTNPFNLLPYFYPRYTPAKKNCDVFDLPSYAHIANAAFSRVPAVYRDKTARDYYLALAKEYFLQ